MISEVALQYVQLIVIYIVELLTLLSLLEVVSFVLVAILNHMLFEFLHSQYLKLENYSVLDVVLGTLEHLLGLLEVFDVYLPSGGGGLKQIQGVLLLKLEGFGFGHISLINIIND